MGKEHINEPICTNSKEGNQLVLHQEGLTRRVFSNASNLDLISASIHDRTLYTTLLVSSRVTEVEENAHGALKAMNYVCRALIVSLLVLYQILSPYLQALQFKRRIVQENKQLQEQSVS